MPQMLELGPANGLLTVRTSREGMAARAGHDLVIEVERWSATVELAPSESEPSRLEATVDARSLHVREGSGGIKPLTDADRDEIQRNIAHKILRSDRHPDIAFRSTSIEAAGEGRWRIRGELTIAGTKSPLEIPLRLAGQGVQAVLSATVAIEQSRFGIKPFRAMMGSLKVADTVVISAEARPSQRS